MADNFKPRYSSTVFACDQSPDSRYIRCDFPQCAEHGQAKPSWMLNTVKNVRLLEAHVGQEIHTFMKTQPLNCVFSESSHKQDSKKVISKQQLQSGIKKVLAIFSLKDSQSQMGDWISMFLDAAFKAEHGDKSKDFIVITQDFISRNDLMKSIANLEFLKFYMPQVEVTCVLSCHSSSQGQVFSCTPTDISKMHGFEEFCSLHDFTLACQDALEKVLTGVHISSCFTLKLDCSHQDWPVDSSWLKTKCKCALTGSIREVYETGSQVCDLYLLLSSMLGSSPQTCRQRLQSAIHAAKSESFPDLAREMGLEILDGQTVDSKLQQPGYEDQVSPPNLVNSEVLVALLVDQEQSYEDLHSQSMALSQALTTNLSTRNASDIHCSFHTLIISVDKESSMNTKACLRVRLNELPFGIGKVLFVVLSPSLANPSTGLIDAIRAWSSSIGGNKVYGIHFQEISALQAYYVKNRLKEEAALSKHNKTQAVLEHIAITGLVDFVKKPHVSFPVLLYLVHLAIGENGARQPKKRLSSGIYSKKPLIPGTSHWTLEEVYTESCHVLSGLTRKCSLQMLSISDTSVAMDTKSRDQDSGPLCSTVDDKVVVLQSRPTCSIGLGTEGMADTLISGSTRDTGQYARITKEEEGFQDISKSGPSTSGSGFHKVKIKNEYRQRNSPNKRITQSSKASKGKTKDLLESCQGSATETSALNDNYNPSLNSQDISKNSLHFAPDLDDVIVVDSDSDSVSCNESNSKGIQADFAPLSTSEAFHNNLKRTGTTFMRMPEEQLDSFVSQKEETSKKKLMKRRRKRSTERNITIEHFSSSDHIKEEEQSEPVKPSGSSKKRKFIYENEREEVKKAFPPTDVSIPTPVGRESTEEIPLLANVDEVLVTHYVLDLSVDFEKQVMTGSIVLFIDPSNDEASKKSFHLCLDSTLVNIKSVSEVYLPEDFKVPFFGRNSKTSASKSAAESTDEGKGSRQINKDDEPMSPDQSDAAKSTPRKSKSSGLSIFQKLENKLHLGMNVPEVSLDKCDNNTNDPREVPSSSNNELTKPSSLQDFLDLLNDKSSNHQPLSFKGLKYSVYGWCIKVNKEGATGQAWPRCICIKYQTSPEGQSLAWTKDQDGRPCVFSPGAYINNRSLMPCQEPPIAMSTWQAAIRVPKGCMVVMSGNPIARDTASLQDTHFYEMDTALPCSTLAIAVGWFVYREGPSAFVPTTKGSQENVPCSVISVPSLIEHASSQLLEYAVRYLEEACKLLGPYPFDRLDLLILPRCFACMGLKSPNLAFLSQSILSLDGSLRLRVAHEVTHAWFGLLIGAKDWTEEWLSEGFATYLEDTVQSRAEKWSEEKDQHYREIRQVLRHRTLSAEMQVTDRDMQCLRPKKTKQNLVERAEESNTPSSESQPAPSTVIKYKCSKKWTQVHYLKGYFLLIHMENMVGREHFEKFLHNYVQYYQGQLVTSEDFFGYFMQSFPMLEGAVQDRFMREWLESSGMPKCLKRRTFASHENTLVNDALSEFEFWRSQDVSNKRTKSSHAKNRPVTDNVMLGASEQIVLMLEKLLQRDKILHSTLRQLNRAYDFASRNAEIRHRWCELIVKHKLATELKDVKQFLIEDQGMGIYLFGELIISGQAKQRALADEIFQEIGPEMDRCTFKTVTDMLQGVD